MSDAYVKMDKMYRFQRYFYDFTRKYYLLGRDQLIDEMAVETDDRILEIGCGSGRNLSILSRKYPQTHFYGLDASANMLETARSKLARNGCSGVTLERALADAFGFEQTFRLAERFDVIFFSYSISMIPTWRESIENALENLKPGGYLYFVDFYDQRELPGIFASLLQAWLRKFHVVYPTGFIPFLDELSQKGMGNHTSRSIYKSYSFISEFQKTWTNRRRGDNRTILRLFR